MGAHAKVYRYMIKNHKIAVKCFKDQDEAEKERDVL